MDELSRFGKNLVNLTRFLNRIKSQSYMEIITENTAKSVGRSISVVRPLFSSINPPRGTNKLTRPRLPRRSNLLKIHPRPPNRPPLHPRNLHRSPPRYNHKLRREPPGKRALLGLLPRPHLRSMSSPRLLPHRHASE